MTYLIKTYNGLPVCYLEHLDGGGDGFGQDYIPVIQRLFGKVDRVFEFCAGPGFIGFSLLANGLCKSLCLSDINPEAVAAARDTIRRNRLDGIVTVYESDALDHIPATEKWDLVVSNPPHFSNKHQGSIRHYDEDWAIHKRFYSGVKRHLKPGGRVLIQENSEGSSAEDFRIMIREGGLVYDGAFMWADRKRRDYLDTFYYVASRRAEDANTLDFSDLIDCSAPAGELDLARTIHLEEFGHYKLTTSVMAFRLQFGLVPRFLRSVDEGAIFHLYPGRYVLKSPKQTVYVTSHTRIQSSHRNAPL